MFDMDLFLTESELARLRCGFYPDNHTKWFIYLNENKIHVRRSSFGYCIFELNIRHDGERYRIVSGVVNRNRELSHNGCIKRTHRSKYILDLNEFRCFPE